VIDLGQVESVLAFAQMPQLRELTCGLQDPDVGALEMAPIQRLEIALLTRDSAPLRLRQRVDTETDSTIFHFST